MIRGRLFVYHYSIPNFDATGGGAIEDGADIESCQAGCSWWGNPHCKAQPLKKPCSHNHAQTCCAIVRRIHCFRPRLGVSRIHFICTSDGDNEALARRRRPISHTKPTAGGSRHRYENVDRSPDLAEQKQVVAYLDREISRIDTSLRSTITLARLANARFSSLREGLLVERSDVAWCPLHRLVDSSRPIVYGIVQAGPHVPDGIPYIRTGDVNNLDPERA